METITLTVDKSVLEEAQRVAEEQQITRDAVLNEWLSHRAVGVERVRRYDALMEKLKYVKTGGPFTREEMNERR